MEHVLEQNEKLALWLARIAYGVSTFAHLPKDEVPAAHRVVCLVWGKQLAKPSCELVELLTQFVEGVEVLLDRARWAHLSYGVAATLRTWPKSRDSEGSLVAKLAETTLASYRGLAPEGNDVAPRAHEALREVTRDFAYYHGGPAKAAMILASRCAGCSPTALRDIKSRAMVPALNLFATGPSFASWMASIIGILDAAERPGASMRPHHYQDRELLLARTLALLGGAHRLIATAPQEAVSLALNDFMAPRVDRLVDVITAAHAFSEKQAPLLISANGLPFVVPTLQAYGQANGNDSLTSKAEVVHELLGAIVELGTLYDCRLDLRAAVKHLRNFQPERVSTVRKSTGYAYELLAAVCNVSLPTMRARQRDLESGAPICSFGQLVEAAAAEGTDWQTTDTAAFLLYVFKLQEAVLPRMENETAERGTSQISLASTPAAARTRAAKLRASV